MNQNTQREGMEIIMPRESEIDRQLLPGSVLRDINLVESVAELRKQMEDSNSAVIRTKKRIMIVSAILAIGVLFFAFKTDPIKSDDAREYIKSSKSKAKSAISNRAKLAKYLKLIGTALAVLSLVKGASNKENKIKVVPSSKDFSHEDKVYSIFMKVSEANNNSPFMRLVVKAILDVLIASKMIEPYEIRNKQMDLKSGKNSDLDANIINSIIYY